MIKKILTFVVALVMMYTIISCDTYTYTTTQDDIYVETSVDIIKSNVSFDVIIQYGTPYYRDDILLYYLYRDIYYYPFYCNNYWYVRAYRRPFTHFDHRPYFRPHRYDYRFSPGHYRGFDRPRDHNVHFKNVVHNHNRGLNNRRTDNRRPDIMPRQSNPDRRIQPTRPNRQITPNRTTIQRNGNNVDSRNRRR